MHRLLALVAILAPGCGEAPVERSSPARTLGVFSPALADNLEEQAFDALRRDAFRREARFREAVDPGATFRSTRVEQAELEAGLWSAPEIFELGAQLFHLSFTREQGFGAADLPPLARFHTGRRGGPDAHQCANCHWRGGPAGAGDGADNAYLDGDGDTQDSALARNPRSLVGAGVLELLAREMTTELQAQRDALAEAAREAGKPLRADLVAKGVSFGRLGALPDGSLDTRLLEGVDADLVVRPFGWKGSFSSIRDAVEESLLVHHGMQSGWLVENAGPDRIGSAGGTDPDGDGVLDEITEGQVSALTLYVAMQEIPIVAMPSSQDQVAMWAEGRRQFEAIGCAGCHRPSMELKSTLYMLPSREDEATIEIDLAQHGAGPRIDSPAEGAVQVWLYSDLRRHDMGSSLADDRPDRGVEGQMFLTPALWGLSRSRPYLHDGRAPTVQEAILAHGGEAKAARDAYAALSDHQRYPLRLFLATLNRAPRMVSP